MDIQIYKYGDAVITIFSTLRCEHTKMKTVTTRNRDAAIKERKTGRDNDTWRKHTSVHKHEVAKMILNLNAFCTSTLGRVSCFGFINFNLLFYTEIKYWVELGDSMEVMTKIYRYPCWQSRLSRTAVRGTVQYWLHAVDPSVLTLVLYGCEMWSCVLWGKKLYCRQAGNSA